MKKSNNSILKLFGSTMIIVGTMIGAGILALPIITAKLGFVISTAIILVIWSIMTYTAIIITDISCSMPTGTSFKTIAEKFLGKIGAIVATLSFVVLMYCISTAYISAVASALKESFPNLNSNFASIIFVIIFGAIVVLGTRFVDYANRIFIILKIIILLILCLVLSHFVVIDNLFVHPVALFSSLIISIPVFATSFTSHIIIPTLSDYLNKNAKDLKKVIIIGSVIPLILYIVWIFAILGTLPLHGKISFMNSIFHKIPVSQANIGDILAVLGSKVETKTTDIILHLFTYIAIITSFLSVNLSLLHFNVDTYHLNKIPNKLLKSTIGIILTFVLPLAIIFINPNIFIHAMTYVGLCIAILLIIMPCLIAFKAEKKDLKFNYKFTQIKIFWVITIISGIIVICCGL